MREAAADVGNDHRLGANEAPPAIISVFLGEQLQDVLNQLIDKAKQHFEEVRVISPGKFTHSKLNSSDKNFDSNHEAEVLIVCR